MERIVSSGVGAAPVAFGPRGVGLAALLLGAVLVFGAGFASPATLHDTAHDVRHAYGLPCH